MTNTMDMDIDHNEVNAGEYPQWPVEVWFNMLSFLDVDDLKSASLASSLHHNIAIKLIFKSITLQFGRWQSEDDRLDEVEDEETERYNSERSLSALICLEANSKIAEAVVKLTIHAFTSYRSQLVFEIYHIERVLAKMSNLCEFSWVGGYPALPLNITKALRGLNRGISSLSVNGLDDDSARKLFGLGSLHVLNLVDPNQHSGEWDPEADLEPGIANALLNSGLANLRELSLPGRLARRVNILRLADSLRRIVICGAGDCIGLDIVLREAHVLESLSVIDSKDFAFLQTVSVVDGGGRPLANLKDLKLSLAIPLAHEVAANPSHPRDFLVEAHQLADFLALHTDLRRFDFAIEPVKYFNALATALDTFANAKWFLTVLNAVFKLRSPSALGISVPKLPPKVLEGVMGMFKNLPKTCVALRLTGLAEVSYYPLVEDILSSFPRLSFLAIANWRPLEHIHDWMPLPDVSDLLRHLPRLRLVCHNHIFYDVDPSGLSTADFPSWSEERMRFRSVQDFPSEDAYWLMAYRFITKKFISGPEDHGFPEEDFEMAL